MIRALIHALGAAIAYTAPARPYNLRDRCADAQARAADPAVADDAWSLLAAHREIARLREELATCRADRDAALDRLQALLDERHAPTPTAPAKTLRDFVREELTRCGYAPNPIGVLVLDDWHIELRSDHLARRWTVTGPVATYPYRPDDVEGTLTDIGAVIERAVAAFDAAGGGR
jgi:hypothetical protein